VKSNCRDTSEPRRDFRASTSHGLGQDRPATVSGLPRGSRRPPTAIMAPEISPPRKMKKKKQRRRPPTAADFPTFSSTFEGFAAAWKWQKPIDAGDEAPRPPYGKSGAAGTNAPSAMQAMHMFSSPLP